MRHSKPGPSHRGGRRFRSSGRHAPPTTCFTTAGTPNVLSEHLLTLQGDGDYEGMVRFVEQYGQADDQLQTDLGRLSAAGIPVDGAFEQGPSVLEL